MAVAPEARTPRLAADQSETAEQLFQTHSGWIYGYCLRVLRSPEEAEDALQATYLNACRSLNQGTRPQQGSAWLLRIAQNVCFTKLRSFGRRSKVERVQDIAILEDTVAAPEHENDDLFNLTGALLDMPERQRTAILLREWKGLTYAEIASELGMTQSAVETLIFRARRSLAAGLESPTKRTRLRSLHAFDLAGLVAAIKGFLAGGAGVKVAALTVAAATTATVVATDPAGVWRDRPARVQEPARTQSAQAAPQASSVVGPPIVENDEATGLPRAPVERTRASEPKPKAAEKAKDKEPGHPGSANGKAQAPGQVEKVEGTHPRSNGRGTAEHGRPDSPGQGTPPPHAQAKGLEKAKKKSKA
jgi:RNA polymerase sigma-70 factor, ECF subfamily